MALLCGTLLIGLAEAAVTQPNLVMMVLDDVGWADVGYHGSDFPTHNIDRLAKTGLRLENFYVQQVCSPTRSALMTGRYPFRTGMQHCTTLMPGSGAKLPSDVPTIAETLRTAGYSTAAIGKWHLGFDSWEATPTGRGFDSFLGYLNGQTDYYNKTVPALTGGVGVDFWRNQSCAWEEVESREYTMDIYMREAERLLDAQDASKPFFLYFAHQQLHIPLQGPPEPKYAEECAKHIKASDPDNVNRLVLCAMMSRLDAAIGEFEVMLKARGLWENTLLWVMTDNGGMTQYQPSFPGSASSNFPLRGGKTTLFQGGVRGISFLNGGLLPTAVHGKEYTGLIQHVDVPATMAKLAGTSLQGDGLDVWTALSTFSESPRLEVPLNVDTSFLASICHKFLATNTSDNLKLYGEGGLERFGLHQNYSAIIHGNWKLINGWSGFYDGYWTNSPYHKEPVDPASQGPVMLGGESVWLFDLHQDPEERHNVASEHPETVQQLQVRLMELADANAGYRDPQNNVPEVRSIPKLHNGTWSPWMRASPSIFVV